MYGVDSIQFRIDNHTIKRKTFAIGENVKKHLQCFQSILLFSLMTYMWRCHIFGNWDVTEKPLIVLGMNNLTPRDLLYDAMDLKYLLVFFFTKIAFGNLLKMNEANLARFSEKKLDEFKRIKAEEATERERRIGAF
ncbi:hypothetical protein ACJX0J_040217, partial [Zea mays]